MTRASVVNADTGDVLGAINGGLVVLVCADPDDTADDCAFFARKIAAMRLFEDDAGKMNRSVLDVGGKVLAVSQFTLAADWRRGNRPGFSRAADPETAERLYRLFCDNLRDQGVEVATGRFRTAMQAELVNDGPVTIWMDSKKPD